MALAVAALAVLATVAPEQAAAQSIRTFISNTGQTSSSASNVVLGIGFTTGAGTYTVSSIEVVLRDQSGSPTPEVRIYEDNSGNPGTLVATMANPGAITEDAVNTYTAPPNTTLSASTAYWVVTRNSAGSTGTGLKVGTVAGSALDSGTAPGWSIGNGIFKNSDSDTSWRTSNIRIRFQVRGAPVNTDPTVENPIPDQSWMAGTAFSYQFPADTFADAEGDMLIYSAKQSDNAVLPTWLRFSAATRTFSGTPPAVETVSVKVTARDRNGGSANDEFDIVVVADSIPPSLTSAVVPADGNTIQLAFSEDLSANRPPVAAFTVTVGGSAVTVTGVAAGTTNDVLQITVSPLIGQSRAVVVAYDDPTVLDNFEAIQDIAGNDTPDFTTGAGDVPAVTNDSAIPNAAPDGWSLTPTGLAAGAKFRLLFLSSTRRDALSSDIADYNTFVQARAAAGHADIRAYSGAFRALGCTAAVDARDNTSTTGTGVPIYWLDGAKVADDYADFYDGSWDDEVNDKNESGADAHDTSQSDNYPITGCKDDGTESFAGATRPRSLGAPLGFVRIGRPNSSEGPIDGNDVARTNLTRPMYGLSAVFEVVSTTFISNTGQTSNSSSNAILATAFTTGASTYTLSSVGLHLVEQTGTPTPVVGIYGDSGGNPGTLLATMTNPDTLKINAVNTFTAPADTRLSSNTTYWVVTMGVTVNLSTGSTLDSGTAPGWSLGNSRFKTTTSATSWSTNALPILFQIRGKVRPENNPATGAPTITGTAEVRQTLTAVTTAIMDVDGLTNVSYTYQWIRVATDTTETNIGSATASTYTLVTDDLGTTIKVKVGFTDDASNPETLTSEATAVVTADTTPPTLTGATILVGGQIIELQLSENVQRSNLPLVSAFTVTADGSAVTLTLVFVPAALDTYWISVPSSSVIRQGQVVVVTYTDPTAGDDVRAIQDVAGTDVADFTTGMNGAPAVINNSTVATAVPDGWSLTPTGLAAGDRFRLLFLSSTKRNGSSTDIATYNTFIQNLAAAGHTDIRDYSAGFRVVGCTADTDARDNTSTTYISTAKGVPIYWLNGAKAADQYEDFYDGSWDDEANDKNESGANGPDTSQSGNYPLTGCNDGGTEYFDRFNSSSALAKTEVMVGRPNSSGVEHGPLSSNTALDVASTATRPMYGLSALFQVPGTAANDPATGAPTITGTAQVGQTLTAVTTAIMDTDGLTTPGYTYQWIRVATDTTETNIGSATASTYTLVTADLGTTIKVKVSFTDDASNAETLTSVATAAVTADTTSPMLVSATVTSLGLGTIVEMDFDERLKRPSGGQFPALVVTLTTVTVDGVEVDFSALASTDGISVNLQLQSGAKIRSGQTVVIAYFDNTSGNDTDVFEDNAGNDVATFTTGMNGVPPVTNNSTVAPVAPGAPTGLTATANGSTQIDLSWTAPADSGGRVITGYKIEISSDAGNAWTTHLADTTSADTHYEHTGLAASTTRDYRVSAINTIGTSPASNVDDATTGAGTNNTAVPSNWSLKPTGLAVGDQFRLLFLSSTKRNAQTTDIAVYNTFIQTLAAAGHTDIRDYSAGFRVVGCTADTDARDNTSTNYTGTGTAKGVPIYWLDGTKAADEYADFYDGSWDDEANDKNESGTNSHDTSMALNYPWTGCGHDGTEAVVVSTSFALGTSESIGSGVGRPNSSAAVNGPLGSDDNAVNTSTRPMYGLSAVFQVATAVVNSPATGAPTITGTAQVGETLTAGTTAIMDTNGLTTPGYTYQWIRVATDTTETNIGSATASTYTLVLDDLGTTIKVKVSFTDDASNAETRTSVATAAVTAANTAPGAPTGLTATASGNTQIDLSWTAPASDGGSAITGYKIEISSDGGNAWTTHLADTTSPATTYEHTGLAAGTTRHYRVSAINTNGAGAASNVDGATTGTTVPDAPTGLAATASGNTRIDLSWTAPASDGGSAITGYKIEESPNGNSNWTTLEADTTSPATTYEHTGLSAGTTRHYRVSAINSNGAGAASSVDDATTGTTVPGAPTGLTATASGTTRIDLSWTAPAITGGSPITGYKIEESPNGNSNWTTLEADTNATTYAHTGLAGGTTRHYRVSAINSNGAGAPSNVDDATTGTTVPDAPTSLAATASGTTRINLSWTAPGSDGGSSITGYRIEESPNGNSSWTTLEADTNGPATTYSHTGLSGGTTRHYRVSAINSNGAGAPSNVDGATTGTTVPDAPTVLTATASGTTRINLSWTAPASDGGSPITGYRIEESPNGRSSWAVLVATTGGASTTHSDTGLPGGTTRHYRVSAINTNGAGTPSNVAGTTTGTTVPGAPTSLAATASGTARINLSWTAPARDGGTPITGYRIEESPDGTSSWTDLVTDTTDTRTTYSHTGLPGGTTRHYRVSAINSNGAGAPSSVDGATTGTSVPGAPTDLSARASGTTQVDLSWTAPASDGGSPVTGYRIEESPDGRSSWNVLVATTGSPATSYSRTGLASGATRHYRVSAVNTNGAGAPSNTASTTTGTTVPGAPTRLTAAASGTTRINLSWTAPASNGGIRITGYRIESSLGSGSSWTDVVANTGTTGTTYSDTGLSGGTTRYYRVSAINTNGAGAPSNVDGATTGTTVPDAPTDLTARVSENTRINLSWARPASDGGSLVTGYRIEISSDGGSSWTDRVANTRSPHRAYSHIVAAGATRHYRVSAISAKGTSAHSNVASATTVLRRVRFEADLYTAREGGAAATVAVVLSAAAPAAVTIPLTREHLSGATEADYSGVPAGVTFAAGQARQTFTVTVTEDSDEDGLKRLRLQFGTLPSGYASDPPRTAVVRLVDNDGDLLVDFGTARHTTVQVREHADVRHRFSVYLRTNRYGPPNNNQQQALTIPLVVQHVGGAEEDVDYTPRIPASVTFAAGQSQASFSIRAIPDGERESGEGLRIDFGPLPSGVARGEWGPYETIEFLDAGAPASANLSVAGPLLTLGYPGALDGGSTPSPRDFVVSAEAPGGEKAMAPVAAVSVRGSDVFLQLARPVLPDETVTLSYLADAMHPIREAAGLPAPALTDAPVRNDTPASGPGPEAGLPVQAGIPAAMAVLPEEAPVGAQTQRLDLSSRNLTDLSALAGLTGLRELDLRHNAVEDLWPLAGLTGLRVLHLSANRIADLSPLAGLTGLRVLHLSANRIGDLSPLAGLSGLQVLDLAGNQLEDLWPLAGLTALERLNLSDNRIEELWPLAGLSGLEVLLLDRNRVADLSALLPLAELANLGLSGNRIADLWPLAGLDQLRRLDLSGNAVEDVSALGDVSGLVWLRLPGNPVSDVAPLGRLEKLLWLWLDSGTAAGMEALAPPAGHGAAQLWIELTPGIEGDGPGPQRAAPGHKRRFE